MPAATAGKKSAKGAKGAKGNTNKAAAQKNSAPANGKSAKVNNNANTKTSEKKNVNRVEEVAPAPAPAVFDPFAISTIGDDEEVPDMEFEGDGLAMEMEKTQPTKTAAPTATTTNTKQQKKNKKGQNQQQPTQAPAPAPKKEAPSVDSPTKPGSKEEMNPSFTFDADGGMNVSKKGNGAPASSWDFTSVKEAIARDKPRNPLYTSIDEKIQKVMNGKKKTPAPSKSKPAQKKDDEESDDDGGESDDSGLEFEGMSVEGSDVDDDDEGDDDDDEGMDVDEEEGDEEDDDEGDEEEEEDQETVVETRVDSDGDEEDIVKDKRKAEYFSSAPAPTDDLTVESFTDLNLSRPILKAIAALGYTKPTPIQARTIPLALQGIDICGAAVTGSGKTASFIIPILERLLFRPKNVPTIRVLILVPTRELGIQCHSVAQNLAKFTDIRFCLCVGGLSNKTQEAELRQRPDVVIATPGRLIDHIHNSPSFNLDTIEILIMDEADRILEDGFADELNEIVKYCPKGRQTMLFSATMTDNVDQLIRLSLNRPVRLFIDPTQSIASRLTQEFIRIRSSSTPSSNPAEELMTTGRKPAILLSLVSRTYTAETIIFFRSKAFAHRMKIVFGLCGLKAAELHGSLTQMQRLEALEMFRDRKVDFLLCTDLASRGLDIAGIKTVINYDMPKNYAQYVHRVGRTARANNHGRAVSLCEESDRKVLKLAIKNAPTTGSVKHRLIAPAVIAKFVTKLDELKERVDEVLGDEKEEKVMAKAEMELARTKNIMDHAEEIGARPKREWFQSSQDKAKSKELALQKHLENFGLDQEEPKAGSNKKRKVDDDDSDDELMGKKPKRGKFDGLSRHKKRLKMAREEDPSADLSQKRVAKAAKSAKRPQRLTQFRGEESGSPGGAGPKKGKGKKKAG
ncbi:nucleolar DEAD-box protein required for synthesis of 60S ribosomal subunit, partial [Quaeritorhiza haematococci]